MSYVDTIPAEELNQYENISDWQKYFDDLIKSKSSLVSGAVSIEIRSCIIESEISFIGGYSYSIRFEKCYFKKPLSFFSCTINKDITFNDCFFDESLFIIEDVYFKENFHIFSCSIKKFIIAGGEFNKCYWNISDCDSCIIGRASFGDLRIIVDKQGINDLRMWANELSGFITVTGETSINNIQLEGFSKNLSLSIEDIYINKLNVHRYRSDDGLRFLNIKSGSMDSEISVSESYLGKAEFYLIDLSKFNSVNIVDTHIVDCSFINII